MVAKHIKNAKGKRMKAERLARVANLITISSTLPIPAYIDVGAVSMTSLQNSCTLVLAGEEEGGRKGNSTSNAIS